MFIETTAYKKVSSLKKRLRVIQGGTSASKTISILLYLIAMAQTDKKPTITSIVSESIPHLKRGAMRDFRNILEAHGYWKDGHWNATDFIYTFETGSKIEFFSTDGGTKMRGARRDRLFINEANLVTFEAFEQMEVRTKGFIILDYNPSSEFWAHEHLIDKRDDVDFLILTYKDNEGLDASIIASIESRRNRAGWWKVYGEGQLGEVEGRIYSKWQIMDGIPFGAKLIRRGLDFGYTNDPTAVVDVWYFNGGYILDEVLYRKGLSNKDIYDKLHNMENNNVLTVCDSAEPKSIDELATYGLNVMAATKGAGSISQGIQFVQEQTIGVTKRSANLIAEYRNYLWMVDRNGNIINEPEGGDDHCMDALRYAFSTIQPAGFGSEVMRNRVARNRMQQRTIR